MQIDTEVSRLAAELQTGDLVFIRVRARPFLEISAATGSWTNHVGIVIGASKNEVLVAESTFPLSRVTTLRRFIARSEHGRLAVARSRIALTLEQKIRIERAARHRTGIWYDTGFNLRSSRQFCSRFVREVLAEGAGIEVGVVETFAQLLSRQPDTPVGFWRWWYFGAIPWQRETVTPASVMRSPRLALVFDGMVMSPGEACRTALGDVQRSNSSAKPARPSRRTCNKPQLTYTTV